MEHRDRIDLTISAIAEIDDGPHGTSIHYIITKPRFFNFQNFFEDRPKKSSIKTTTRRLEIAMLAYTVDRA